MLLISMTPALEFVRVAVFGPPALPTATLAQLMDDGETVAEVAVELPVPDKATESAAEPSLMVQVAERAPEAVGLKTRFAVQLAEAGRVEAQVVEKMAKSPALVPEMAAPLRVTELDVLLVMVTDCALLVPPTLMLPKLKLDGDAVTAPEATPRPESATSCGLPAASSVKASAAVRVPAAVGLKSTVTTQFADAARVAPQVFL